MNRFLIPGPGQEIEASPLKRQVNMYRRKPSSLSQKTHRRRVSLPLAWLHQPSPPRASCSHRSTWTLQQPDAIRAEPAAAILINIDLVSAYPPSGSAPNSRYCISANTSLCQYREEAASLNTAPRFASAERPPQD